MRATWTSVLGLSGLVVFLNLAVGDAPVLAAGAGAASAPHLKMTMRDGRLSARIASAPRRRVMEEVSRVTGAEVRWLGHAEGESVSTEFVDLSLAEALERILKRDFAVSHPGPEAGRTQIWILSGGAGAVSTLGAHGRPAGDAVLVTRERPSPASGEECLPPNADNEIDLSAQPPSTRLQAVHLLARSAESYPAARAILWQVAQTDDDPRVRELARRLLDGNGLDESPGASACRS